MPRKKQTRSAEEVFTSGEPISAEYAALNDADLDEKPRAKPKGPGKKPKKVLPPIKDNISKVRVQVDVDEESADSPGQGAMADWIRGAGDLVPVERLTFDPSSPQNLPGKPVATSVTSSSQTNTRRYTIAYSSALRHHIVMYYRPNATEPTNVILIHETKVTAWFPAEVS